MPTLHPRELLKRIKWPPTVESVNQYGCRIVGAVLAPAVVLMLLSARDSVSDKEQEWLDQELQKRRQKLSEMITLVSSHLLDLSERRQRKQQAGATDEELDDDASLEVQISYVELLACCGDAEEIDRLNTDLGRGLTLSADLMRLQLQQLIRKTRRGDTQYRDGTELERLLGHHGPLVNASRKFHVSTEDRSRLSESCKELWKEVYAGERLRNSIRNRDLVKALRLVWLAKKAIPSIVCSTAISASSGMLTAMDILYRTQSVEIFRKNNWQWSEFVQVTKAVLLTRAISSALRILRARIDAYGNREMGHVIRTEMYKALLRQDFEWYRLGQKDARDVGQIFSSIFSVPRAVSSLISLPTQVISIIANIGTQFAIIRQRSSRLLYAMMALYWARHFSCRFLQWLERFLGRTFVAKVITPDDNVFMEPLQPENLETVRSFAGEEKALSMWSVFWKSAMRNDEQFDMLQSTVDPLYVAVSELKQLAEHSWAGQLVRDGDMQASEMENLMHFSSNVSSDMHSAYRQFKDAQTCFAPLAKAWDVISLEPKIGMEGGRLPNERRAKGEITFRDVSFKYPTGNEVLRSVSFTVPAGQVCGITGATGGGKSTIFKLIERFYDTKEGAVLLDGVDVRDLNPLWLRKQISVVSQKPRFLRLPLRENLAYGCEKEPSTAAIEEACRAANIYDLVFNNKEKFPAGLYTYVTGQTLSGGELQRLAIARAILMDAPILLLDEATSALDSESQAAVNGALQNLMQGRTVLSIAHRLEAIKDSNLIVCLGPHYDVTEGASSCGIEEQDDQVPKQRRPFTVVEEGTHADLVQKGGIYAGLYRRQVEATAAVGDQSNSNQYTAHQPVAIITALDQDVELQGNAEDSPQLASSMTGADTTSIALEATQEQAERRRAWRENCISELMELQQEIQEEALNESKRYALMLRIEGLIQSINSDPQSSNTVWSPRNSHARRHGRGRHSQMKFKQAVRKVMLASKTCLALTGGTTSRSAMLERSLSNFPLERPRSRSTDGSP